MGLINYPNTLFSQCEVTLGDRLISQASHPHRAIIKTLLNFSKDALKSQFSAGLFYKETAGAIDSSTLTRANALYPVSRIVVNTFPIPKGIITKYVVLGMVHHNAFRCKRDLSHFNFRHNDVENLALCQSFSALV